MAATISQAEFASRMRRFGFPDEVVQEITAQLADPIDVDRDRAVLERYGVTAARLMERMGGSP